jgi:hypothetical protein
VGAGDRSASALMLSGSPLNNLGSMRMGADANKSVKGDDLIGTDSSEEEDEVNDDRV